MQVSPHRTIFARIVSCTTIVVLFLFCSVSVAHAGTIMGCNANGTYKTQGVVHFCTDPDSGLRVGYIIYVGFSWQTSDGVIHSFPIGTIQNSSNGYGPDGGVLCGPDDLSTGSATATDGSGFTMVVNSYYHAQIYDGNGNLVFDFGHGTFCN